MSYQVCNRCVMDTTDPDIVFDENGYCNHCNEFIEKRSKHVYQGEASDILFNNLIQSIKKSGKGKKYDCILGLSGGIDSSYAAYIAVQNGLRVLGVHLDNGWNSEEAVLNIKNIARKLHIDYESYVLNWDEFKDLQLSFLKASVPEAETPTDIAIPAALHKIAGKYNVKHIISGGNFATEGILPRCWHYNAKDLKYLKFIHRKFGAKRLKSFPLFGFQHEMYYKLIKGISIDYLLNYVPYNKKNAMELLKNELEWRNYGGKHYESKYTGFIQSYYMFHKFPIDYRRATFSTLICTGETTREEALIELEKLPYNPEKIEYEKQYIAKKLGISLDEFETILNAAPHWYRDYPNNEKMLGFIYDSYRRLYGKEKSYNF